MEFLKRRIVAILISVAVVFVSSGVLVIEVMQERAEERRIIAEQEAEEQRLLEEAEAEEQRLREEAEAELQAAIDFIEERISDGYDSWTELITWAEDQDIAWYLMENGERASVALMESIMTYGISGNYLGAEVGMELQDDPDEVILLLNFENLTYQEMIAELSNLDDHSLEELDDWLENGGLERIETAFYETSVIEVDESGIEITEEAEFGKEFISWSFRNEPLVSFENSSLRIERRYEILAPDRETVEEMIITALEELPSDMFIEREGRNDVDLASLLEIDEAWINVTPRIVDVRLQLLASNREPLESSNRRHATVRNFASWEFTHSRTADDTLRISIYQTFDLNPGRPGVSRSNFTIIEDGMTIEEVGELLRVNSTLTSSSGDVETHRWRQRFSGNVTLNIYVTFENGLVIAKEMTETPTE